MPEQRGRWYALPPQERDRLIVTLRRRGWTYARIAKAVQMDKSGVRRALQRIKDGRFGEGMKRG